MTWINSRPEVKGALVIAFHGEMGAGKTTLISALVHHLGVKDGVSSPTFSIINAYALPEDKGGGIIYHMDLYRLKDEEEVVQAGVEDCLYSGSICLVEWPEKAAGLLNDSTVHVEISVLNDTDRMVRVNLPMQRPASIK
jgi:tRNA threonylcarbamoyladenosine biosynthesis protein TsaE